MVYRMIRIHISQVAEQRGITTAYQLQKALALPPSMAARLWKGELGKVATSTLDKLCEAFDCQPGDLLSYVAAKKKNRKVAA
jgi:putative transcriptional regulator